LINPKPKEGIFMMDEGDDGARVGLWVTLGVITLLLFGLIGGLALRQMHKAAPAAKPVAAAVKMDADALVDAPLTGELLGKLYFETGSAAVPADSAAAMTAVLAKVGTGKVVLAGFHDASGDAATNAVLAKDRAKAVRAALVAAGLDASRVVLRKPESTTGEGKPEEARRVDIRILP
jgi:outer membrane protein OmpA-like peptidoglycan-associated protein